MSPLNNEFPIPFLYSVAESRDVESLEQVLDESPQVAEKFAQFWLKETAPPKAASTIFEQFGKSLSTILNPPLNVKPLDNLKKSIESNRETFEKVRKLAELLEVRNRIVQIDTNNQDLGRALDVVLQGLYSGNDRIEFCRAFLHQPVDHFNCLKYLIALQSLKLRYEEQPRSSLGSVYGSIALCLGTILKEYKEDLSQVEEVFQEIISRNPGTLNDFLTFAREKAFPNHPKNGS